MSDLLLKHFAGCIPNWLCESENMDFSSEKKKKDYFCITCGAEAVSCVLKDG